MYKLILFSLMMNTAAYIAVRLLFLPSHELRATKTHPTNKMTEQIVAFLLRKDETECVTGC